MASFTTYQSKLLEAEGGYNGDAADLGNWLCGTSWARRSGGSFVCSDGSAPAFVGTNHGIAAPTLAAWRRRKVTEAQMRALTQREALAILKSSFWDANRISEIRSQAVAEIFADHIINASAATATRMMQEVLRDLGKDVTVDKVVGSETIKAINKLPEDKVYNAYRKKRIDFYYSLNNGTYQTGWINRIERYFPVLPAGYRSAAGSGDILLWLLVISSLLLGVYFLFLQSRFRFVLATA